MAIKSRIKLAKKIIREGQLPHSAVTHRRSWKSSRTYERDRLAGTGVEGEMGVERERRKGVSYMI